MDTCRHTVAHLNLEAGFTVDLSFAFSISKGLSHRGVKCPRIFLCCKWSLGFSSGSMNSNSERKSYREPIYIGQLFVAIAFFSIPFSLTTLKLWHIPFGRMNATGHQECSWWGRAGHPHCPFTCGFGLSFIMKWALLTCTTEQRQIELAVLLEVQMLWGSASDVACAWSSGIHTNIWIGGLPEKCCTVVRCRYWPLLSVVCMLQLISAHLLVVLAYLSPCFFFNSH